MANYSDGLAGVNLLEIFETFKQSGNVGSFRPSFSLHLVDMIPEGEAKRVKASEEAELWINGGSFIFRPEIFDYMREGEELVETPFRRVIEADKPLDVGHEEFWRPMDTLQDRQVLEEFIESGITPWSSPEAQRRKLATNRKNA
jgi:glucose-1-phosphate cytidylyltransferase